MKKGILTFHKVYNYGAVLQAYCMQEIVNTLSGDAEIIDFSMPKQKDFTSLYSTRNGLKRFVKTILLIPFHQKRFRRIKKFDQFISKLPLSTDAYRSADELKKTNDIYDIFIVGSDQIWNVSKKAEFSDAYFLSFAKRDKKKISYAASIGTAGVDDLVTYKKLLKNFDKISCREENGSKVIEEITGNQVPTVLDPTLLVERSVLDGLAAEYKDTYILYYSLDGFDKRKNNMDILKALSEKYGLKIKYITPEWPIHADGEDVMDAGIEDFLGLIKNAVLVCTNSFHGTALSIKMNTPFFVLESRDSKDERKRSLLKQLDLMDRIISSSDEINVLNSYTIDFEMVNKKLDVLRAKSENYLKNALNVEV